MGEKQAMDAAAAVAMGVGDQGDGTAPPPWGNDIQYCSEHHRPANAATAAAVTGGGTCAFCLQEKLNRLVSSSNSSPFFPLGGHPPLSGSPSSSTSFRHAAEPPTPPLLFHPSSGASRKFMSFHRKNAPASSSSSTTASAAEGGLKRSKSVAPRHELEQFPCSSSAAALENEGLRTKSFWSFLSLTSFTACAHLAADAAASTPYATNAGVAAAAAKRKSLSVASAALVSRGPGGGAQDQQPRGGTSSTLGRTLEAIGEPESPSQSRVSPSSVGRKVGRSRSMGCGRRSFSGDFLDRVSNGFGDCKPRRVESHREPKPHKMRGGLCHLGGSGAGAGDDDVYEHHQHRIKCAGFFGGLGPASSSYWLSAAKGAGIGNGTKRSSGRSHRSWAWALAWPMWALRPTTTSTSTKTITVVPPVSVHDNCNVNSSASALSIPSPAAPSAEAAPVVAS